ncbi:MAG: DnaT-like ssDNA-binding protein [Clostridia bacterium]|nr:DnaT-like ssDNA-binding protein [Clostridia bacterium]
MAIESYISVIDADLYFGSRYGADQWRAATEVHKTQALITATRTIDMQRLRGRPTSDAQPLAFPRAVYWRGAWSAETEVPEAVKAATCEEALAILSQDTQRATRQRDGLTAVSIGDASESYSAEVLARAQSGGLLSAQAKMLIRPWLVGAVPIV